MSSSDAEGVAMDAATERRLLGLLGLGVRGRGAVVGVDRVREAAKRGLLHVAVIAPDASRHSLDKVVPLLEARRIRIIEGPSAESLGNAVGREATAVVGVTDRALASGVLALFGAGREGHTGPRRAR
ncbi:MAG: L7Ae/L30e/S12e/Gadd45 family ribosomal protein [Gemmatimonadota bacterium]